MLHIMFGGSGVVTDWTELVSQKLSRGFVPWAGPVCALRSAYIGRWIEETLSGTLTGYPNRSLPESFPVLDEPEV